MLDFGIDLLKVGISKRTVDSGIDCSVPELTVRKVRTVHVFDIYFCSALSWNLLDSGIDLLKMGIPKRTTDSGIHCSILELTDRAQSENWCSL